MKDLATTIHLLTCDKKHASNWNADPYHEHLCYWYLEDQVETRWEADDHKDFLKQAEVLARLFMIDPTTDPREDDIKKASRFLVKLANICSEISFMTGNVEGTNGLIYRAIVKILSS